VTGARRELSPEETAERRTLRNSFFEAYRSKKWSRAVELGTALRDRFFLDWEAHISLADSMRRGGDFEGALRFYQAFVAQYPENVRAEEAQLRTAQLLAALGRSEQAVPLFEKLAGDPKGRFRKPAKQALKSLGR
jgi:tetratricopeptide (TPR) repeat protein